MLSDISVLIPWRGGDSQRERVWDHIRSRWESLGVELCVGVDDPDGPFNCSRALNRAFAISTRPYVMQFGADCLPDVRAIHAAYYNMKIEGFPWVPTFEKTDYYNEHSTELILRGHPDNTVEVDPNLHVPFQTGVLAMTREAYLETGGADERFVGWGAEDSAFRRTLHILNPGGDPQPFTLRCLWHDNKHRKLGQDNLALCQEYERIHDRETMLQYIAQRGSYV